MLKEKYKIELKQLPVREELIRATARKMERKRAGRQVVQRTFAPRRLVAVISVICLFAMTATGVYAYQKNDLTANPSTMMVGEDAAPIEPLPTEQPALTSPDKAKETTASAVEQYFPVPESTTPSEVQVKSDPQSGTGKEEFVLNMNGFLKPNGYVAGLPKISSLQEAADQGLIFAEHPEEIVGSKNPWFSGMQAEKLPVYQTDWSQSGKETGSAVLDNEGMKALAVQTAIDFGWTEDQVSELEVEASYADAGNGNGDSDIEKELLSYSVGNVTVSRNGEVEIAVSEEPEEDLQGVADLEKIQNMADYFYDRYRTLFPMQTPVCSVNSVWDFDGSKTYQVRMYDASGDLAQQILSYNLSYMSFEFDESLTMLETIRYRIFDLGEKIGDYPIISVKEAEKELLDGNYTTNVPFETELSTNTIKRVELIYLKDADLNYCQPMYRILVEISDLEENEIQEFADTLKCYGTYYVPAVHHEFLHS